MRNNALVVIGVVGVFGLGVTVTHSQQAGRNGGAAAQPPAQGRGAAPPVPDLPTGKTAFWTSEDIQARWKDNEANKRINSRLFNGPTNISANVRIVLPGDSPGDA